MFKSKIKNNIIISCLTLIITLSVISFFGLQTTATAKMDFEKFNNLGEFVDNDSEIANLLSLQNKENLVQTFLPNNSKDIKNTSNIIATVNGWPISKGEIALRKALRECYGQTADDYFIFNLLVEEKIKLSQAESLGVLPSTEEVQASMDEIKASMQEEEALKKAIELLMDKMQLTEEDYWQVYEYYNYYRFLAFNNYATTIIKQGYDKGLINSAINMDEDTNVYEYVNEDAFYLDKMFEDKAYAKVEILQQNDAFNFSDKNIFFWAGAPKEGYDQNALMDTVVTKKPKMLTSEQAKLYDLNSSRAMVANVYVKDNRGYRCQNSDFGIKTFEWGMAFSGYQFNEHSKQVISPMDVIMYPVYSYDLYFTSRFDGAILNCVGQTSAGSTVSTFTGGWSNGGKFGHITNHGYFFLRWHPGGNLGSQNGSYNVKTSGIFIVDDFLPIFGGNMTITTPTF